jgi:hypothetical protein
MKSCSVSVPPVELPLELVVCDDAAEPAVRLEELPTVLNAIPLI